MCSGGDDMHSYDICSLRMMVCILVSSSESMEVLSLYTRHVVAVCAAMLCGDVVIAGTLYV